MKSQREGLHIVDANPSNYGKISWVQSELRMLAAAEKAAEIDEDAFHREQSIEAIVRVMSFLAANGVSQSELEPLRRIGKAIWQIQTGGRPHLTEPNSGKSNRPKDVLNSVLAISVRRHIQILVTLKMTIPEAKAAVLSACTDAKVANGAGKISHTGKGRPVSKRNIDDWWRERFNCVHWKDFRIKLQSEDAARHLPDLPTAVARMKEQLKFHS